MRHASAVRQRQDRARKLAHARARARSHEDLPVARGCGSAHLAREHRHLRACACASACARARVCAGMVHARLGGWVFVCARMRARAPTRCPRDWCVEFCAHACQRGGRTWDSARGARSKSTVRRILSAACCLWIVACCTVSAACCVWIVACCTASAACCVSKSAATYLEAVGGFVGRWRRLRQHRDDPATDAPMELRRTLAARPERLEQRWSDLSAAVLH